MTPAAPGLPLHGYRVAMTAARKVAEQRDLLERRGAEVSWAPVLGPAPYEVDDVALRTRTEQVLAGPVDVLVGTTGIGMRTWLQKAEDWGLLDPLLAAFAGAEVLARGPKTVGALRGRGLREGFVSPDEDVAGLMERLLSLDLAGRRVVLQEYGEPLDHHAERLRAAGADVELVTVYRIGEAEAPASVEQLVREVAAHEVDAVTFTAAVSVEAFLSAATDLGLRDAVVAAMRAPGTERVVASCVGHVTASALTTLDVPAVHPDRARLTAMVRQLEQVLVDRGRGGGRLVP